MNCFNDDRPAVGICVICQRAVCRGCLNAAGPDSSPVPQRVVCRTCAARGMVFGWEYKSSATFAGWPLVHICTGVDPLTMMPKVARGVIAIGNMAIGAVAIAGLSLGLVSLGGLSIGLFAAVGGAALGTGLSIGGFALGQIAFGGLALGLRYAFGALAVAPAVVDADSCDAAAREFLRQWFEGRLLPPQCER